MPRRPWGSLAGSTLVHGALLLLALGLSRRPAEKPLPRETAPDEPRRQVEMVYLAPTPPPPPPPPAPPPVESPPEPAPPPPRPRAPPPVSQPIPEPRANAPPDAIRTEGTEDEVDDPGSASAPTAPRAEVATMESEARRIFGRARLGPRPGAGPRATWPMESYRPDRPDQCVPHPVGPPDVGTAVQFGMVVGRIFRQNDGRPLAGAHLHMLGTPYVAFTDNDGTYRFRFDLSLVDNCRTQYVRVTAQGYESRLLVLVVGRNVQSENVALRKR